MVNILCEQDETDAAAALEDLWNDLGRRKRVFDALRYRLDVFDRQARSQRLPPPRLGGTLGLVQAGAGGL